MVYLDLSNNNSSSSSNNNNNSRIPKANKVPREHLETNNRSGRRAQPSLNRVDVSCHLQPTLLASINMGQYLAILRLNSLLRDCLVAREVCSAMRSNRVLSSKVANHPHSVCSETRQQHLHQGVADSLVIMPLARPRRRQYPNKLVFSAIRSASQLLSPRTTPLGEALASLVAAHLHPLLVQPHPLCNPSEALH